jgi:3-hydroxyisobutyrate dehydrogenase
VSTVAFIGLGQMGRLMAGNLTKAGITVQSYDLNGSGSHRSPAEAARGAQVLITMLPDGKAVRKAVHGALPGLARGAIVVDMSSSDPMMTRDLEKSLKEKGIGLIDAPVSGSTIGARDATLAIMAGGDAAAVERVRPVLEKMGKRVFHTGALGSGHAMKALNNYVGASGTVAAFEAVLVGKAFGLDPALMVEIFNASTGYNSTTQRKLPQQVLTNAFASGFSAALMSKDVGIAAGLSRGLRLQTPYLRVTSKLWKQALKGLPAGADHTEVYKYLEGLTKTKTKRRPARARRKPAPSRGARAPRSASRRPQRRSTAPAARRR